MWIWALIVACGEGSSGPLGDKGPVDSGLVDTGAGDGGGGAGGDGGVDSEDSGGVEPPQDADLDGFDETEDCDDTDRAVYPGAEEVWNDVDDDCDGRVDADGVFLGEVPVVATAIYEGAAYRYEMTCPASVTRAVPQMSLLLTCTPDPEEPLADLLLGETLTIEGASETVSLDTWSGIVDITSSGGWDTWADAELSWSDWDTVAFAFGRATVSLEISGAATLTTGGR